MSPQVADRTLDDRPVVCFDRLGADDELAARERSVRHDDRRGAGGERLREAAREGASGLDDETRVEMEIGPDGGGPPGDRRQQRLEFRAGCENVWDMQESNSRPLGYLSVRFVY